MFPVAETNAVMMWVAAKINDNAHQEQPDKCYHFDTAEPELELSKDSDTEEINASNCKPLAAPPRNDGLSTH